jgi:glutaredoxin 3
VLPGDRLPPGSSRIGASMAKVEIYTTMLCGYCYRAKKLLQERGAAFTEIDVMTDGKLRDEMRRRAGGRTSVPQIFIDGEHVGGCDDLYALDQAGKLKPLLQANH